MKFVRSFLIFVLILCLCMPALAENGARAKLEYALGTALKGTTVVIGHARHHLPDLANGRVPCTRIGIEG